MYKIFTSCIFVLLFFFKPAFGQQKAIYYDSKSSLQYGFTIKALIGFGVFNPDRGIIQNIPNEKGKPRKKNFYSEYLNWRLGLSGGIGSFAGDNNWLYPSLNIDVMFYQGGIGSKWPGHKRNRNAFMQSDVEVITSYSFTMGGNNRLRYNSAERPGIRNYPLYYFNTFNQPSLQAPFVNSMTLGGNMIWFLTRKKTKFQQVGFLNVHLNRFQFSYANDGPPFWPPLGDKYDRLHTGAGFITYHGDDLDLINLIEVGFDKFTGFSKNAYELGNRLGGGFVYHQDSAQQYYNKGRIYANVAGNLFKNMKAGDLRNQRTGISISINDFPGMDIQHQIHLKGQYPLHAVPNERFISIAPFSYYSQSKIGLQ